MSTNAEIRQEYANRYGLDVRDVFIEEAVKAAAEGAPVCVDCSEPATKISVADHGSGGNGELLPRCTRHAHPGTRPVPAACTLTHDGWDGASQSKYVLTESCGCTWTRDGSARLSTCTDCYQAVVRLTAMPPHIATN